MMRDKILTVFALAWLYCATGHGQTDTRIPCDDKRVEDVVNVTLSKHNEKLTEGAQLALYEILEATKVGCSFALCTEQYFADLSNFL